MKYIFVAILILLLITFIGITLSNRDVSPEEISSEINTAPLNQSDSTQVTTPEEYVIDSSDMYKVTEMSAEEETATLTNREEYWLSTMREEEKLARDIYQKLGDMWGMRIFSNIASSEQTHTDAVKSLLERYSLADPVIDDTLGVFTNPEIQKLYNDLTKQGSESLLAALIVGATIEDLDINDLDKAMSETANDDIIVVYQNLQKGSRNHMRAFIRQIEKINGIYTPQFISVSEYETILSSSQERGRIE